MAYPDSVEFNFPYRGPSIVVYTEGSCLDDDGPTALAGIGGFFGQNHHLNFSLRCPGRQTRNAAEIYAAEHAIRLAKDAGYPAVIIYTDSEYLMKSAVWLQKWKANKWVTQDRYLAKNWGELHKLDVTMKGVPVVFEHVSGDQQHYYGTVQVRQLAQEGASLTRHNYHSGYSSCL